ncbi:hypothetical protein [Xanthovirga aplysinae]|uniref:hypothetical protein n=1 Tax=Xanthovirga aplysinae TaxID=2529853 RepID=UPI0012BC97DD|nr:hypothetical protein [Xanthovirga aplysinae]MTI32577.1 hypothetical protein [Xanthovirga aplysinae]
MLKVFGNNLKLLSFLLFFSNCTHKIITPGNYSEKFEKDIISFESEGYIFRDNGRFEYYFSSDMLSSSKYGAGNYMIKNNKLLLEFTDKLEPKVNSSGKARPILVEDTAQIHYQLEVVADTGESLPGANILLMDENRQLIAKQLSDLQGKAEFKLLKNQNPISLRVEFNGLEPFELNLEEEKSFHFNIKLVSKMKYGTQILKSQVNKKIRIKDNTLLINGKEFEKVK